MSEIKIANISFSDGMHQDNDPNLQPKGSYRESNNGRLVNLSAGNFVWESMNGNKLSFSITTDYKILGGCFIRDALLLIAYLNATTHKIFEIPIATNGTAGTVTTKWSGNLALNTANLIEAWGYYENENDRTLYWIDNLLNKPRALQLGAVGSTTYATTPVEMINFFPAFTMPTKYYLTSGQDVTKGGALYCGTYFVSYRFVNNYGVKTDWDFISKPIHILQNAEYGDYVDYQNCEGGNFNVMTDKYLQLTISSIDAAWVNNCYIELAVFRSTDYNVVEPGKIALRQTITNATTTIYWNGTNSFDTITIEEVSARTVTILKAKTGCSIKNYNTIAHLEERESIEANLSWATHPLTLTETVPVKATSTTAFWTNSNSQQMTLDETGGWKATTWAVQDKPMIGILSNPVGAALPDIRPGMWYYVEQGSVEYPVGSGITYAAGTFFLGLYDTPAAYRYCTPAVATSYYPVYHYLKHRVDGTDTYENIYCSDPDSIYGNFHDYKNTNVDAYMKQYMGGEKYRFFLLPYDLEGKKMDPIYIGDYLFNMRRENLNPLAYNYYVNANNYNELINGNLTGLVINNIDLNDFFPSGNALISKIEIVRSPRIKNTLYEGIIVAGCQDTFITPGKTHIRPKCQFVNHTSYSVMWNEVNDYYFFYTPEHLFGRDYQEHSGNEVIEIVCGLEQERSVDLMNVPGFTFDAYYESTISPGIGAHHYCKMYQPINPVTYGDRAGGTTFDVIDRMQLYLDSLVGAGAENAIPWDETRYVWNYGCNISSALVQTTGRASDSILLNLDIAGTAIGEAMNTQYARAMYVALRRGVNADYGATENSQLIPTGWELQITPAVQASLYHTTYARYFIDKAVVYGGDSYVQLMDVVVNYIDTGAVLQEGMSLYFPVQTTVNIAAREGNHPAKLRGWSSVNNTGGIRTDLINPGNAILEEFNYLDAYSSEDCGIYVVGMNRNFKNIGKRDYRIRYSNEKIPDEETDSWRIFLQNNYIDVDRRFGPITNVREKKNNYYYWQKDGIGYIPVEERALTSMGNGMALALGTGESFKRYDYFYQGIGNSHQHSLVDIGDGYAWFDIRRNMFVHMQENGTISEKGMSNGMRNWFKVNIITDILDNVIASESGIVGGYDPEYQEILMTFIYPRWAKTIMYNKLLQKFVSFTDQNATWYFTNDKHLFSTGQVNQYQVYRHNDAIAKLGQFYDVVTPYASYLQYVINENPSEEKVFDTQILSSNGTFPSEFAYSNTWQSVSETIESVGILTNKNYEIRNRNLKNSIPLEGSITVNSMPRERLRDTYLMVKATSLNQRTTGGILDNTKNKQRYLMAMVTYRKTY